MTTIYRVEIRSVDGNWKLAWHCNSRKEACNYADDLISEGVSSANVRVVTIDRDGNRLPVERRFEGLFQDDYDDPRRRDTRR